MKLIGQILLDENLITKDILETALSLQRDSVDGKKLGEILTDNGFISEASLLDCLSRHQGINCVNLDEIAFDAETIKSLDRDIANRYICLPFSITDTHVEVAISDTMNFEAIQDIELIYQRSVNFHLAAPSKIRLLLNKAWEDNHVVYSEDSVDSPTNTLISDIFKRAKTIKATDVHLEVYQSNAQLKYRVDGVLVKDILIKKEMSESVTARLKVLANLDASKRLIPHDGAMKIQGMDCRLSTIPSKWGESVVIRILTKDTSLLDINKLFVNEQQLKLIHEILGKPYGNLIITGPTGSGKSTTLYSFLCNLNKSNRKIITVEDPVEVDIDDAVQIQIDDKHMTFEKALEHIVRQDPDIIMIGEIRNYATAMVAVQSAQTGHKVFSTLHTNTALGVIERFRFFGVDNYSLASSFSGLIGQRLVKKLCNNCKKKRETTIEEFALTGLTHVSYAEGCPRCNSGISGRTGIYEIIKFDRELRILVEEGKPVSQLEDYICNKDWWIPSSVGALNLLRDGIISLEEFKEVVSE